tara:strand:+ start:247 stop:1080 length:834 start_codon:yes stop_codon:yes gene_type:complete
MSDFRTLVTGCNGYAGRHLFKQTDSPIELIGIDMNRGGYEFETIDLREREDLKKLDQYNFEYVVHLAWDQTSKDIYKNNLKASNNLIDYLKIRGIDGIIFVSSSYASTATDIQYTESKIYAENLIFDAHIPFVIFRPDSLYSIDEEKIKEQLSYMKMGFSISIGKGESLRSPTHISDLVALINQVITTGQFTNKVYDIGSSGNPSQAKMLEILASANGFSPLTIKLPTAIARLLLSITNKVDPEQTKTIDIDRVADLERVIEDFGFTPIEYEDGIRM